MNPSVIVETEPVQPSDPFHQGDVLKIMHSNAPATDPPYGVIINADCDLAHCKVDGVVSYLPLFPFESYFRKFWVPVYIQDRKIDLQESIKNLCSFEDQDIASLTSWLLEEEASAVSQQLESTHKIKSAALRPKIEELSLITRAEVYDDRLLNSILRYHRNTKEENLAKLAKVALKNLGDGGFFLNEIVGLADIGFVARLKRIYSLPIESVHASDAEFVLKGKSTGTAGIRIAKLSNIYRFKAAQLFAQQFSRIGLPDEITNLNELAVQAAVALGGTLD